MQEIVLNLHMHTRYSDGHGSHQDIVNAAMDSGLDAVIVTDHNVWVDGPQGYYQDGNKRLLMLIGEEIHDQARDPQKNHLLVFGAQRELAPLAPDLPRLLTAIRQAGAIAFIAHPVDPAAPAFNEPDISWVDWDFQDISGIELWNAMSEFKSKLKSKLHAVFYAFNPKRIAQGPFTKTLQIWDQLLSSGKKIAVLGGSDAHALPGKLGPIHRTLFPYRFHFQAINTHLFIPQPLSGEAVNDQDMILQALARGRGFVGYDLPADTRGFRFTASGTQKTAWMGDEISAQNGVTFQIRLPFRTECRLIRNGEVIKTWTKRETCAHITTEPGAYRVEVYVHYLGRQRGWIFTNPIYVQ
jgi:hypothetical protein